MAYLSKSRPDPARQRAQYGAFLNRQEIIKAGLNRRDLFKMGLLTGAGMLVARDGLSARAASAAGTTAGQCASPPTTPFTINLPIPPVKQVIDFAPFAGKTLYIENRLDQTDGNGPSGNLFAAGQGILLLKIVVDQPAVADNSVNPATGPRFYVLPSTTATPRVSRSFKFDKTRNGQWVINDTLFDCNTVRFTMTQNAVEHWEFQGGFGWSHPIHIHGEEFQILSGAPGLYGSAGTRRFSFSSSNPSTGVNLARKDVVRLIPRVLEGPDLL
jgi:multicopper oxidase